MVAGWAACLKNRSQPIILVVFFVLFVCFVVKFLNAYCVT